MEVNGQFSKLEEIEVQQRPICIQIEKLRYDEVAKTLFHA